MCSSVTISKSFDWYIRFFFLFSLYHFHLSTMSSPLMMCKLARTFLRMKTENCSYKCVHDSSDEWMEECRRWHKPFWVSCLAKVYAKIDRVFCMERVLLEYEKLSIHFDLWPTFRIQCNKLYAWNSSLCTYVYICIVYGEMKTLSIALLTMFIVRTRTNIIKSVN